MARTQANVYLTIWADPDFLALSPLAKLLYFTLLTHPTLTYCGITDWREARLAKMLGGVTVDELRNAAYELGQRRLIAVDPETEEALVRSFVRHDGVLKSPNLAKGMVREYGAIASMKLRELVTIEARRACAENPEWKGVEAAEPVTKQFPETMGNPSNLVPSWFASGSETVPVEIPQKTGNPSDLVSLPLPLPLPVDKSTEGVASSEATPPATKTKPAAKRSTQLPASWAPNETHNALAKKLGLDPHHERDQFTDKALAKGWTYKDWDRAFNNWLRQAAQYAKRDGLTTTAPAFDAASARYAALPQ